jgi:hypothetical protein
MPFMPGIKHSSPNFLPGKNFGGVFPWPNPIGILLHRTIAEFRGTLDGFLHPGKDGRNLKRGNAHFLVGKDIGNAVQLISTDCIANHAAAANKHYIGIEFESIGIPLHKKGEKVPGLDHGLYVPAIFDELTPFQIVQGGRIIDWICHTHQIPKLGPPSLAELINQKGLWHGVLDHALVSDSKLFATDHGDSIMRRDYERLGIKHPPAWGLGGFQLGGEEGIRSHPRSTTNP